MSDEENEEEDSEEEDNSSPEKIRKKWVIYLFALSIILKTDMQALWIKTDHSSVSKRLAGLFFLARTPNSNSVEFTCTSWANFWTQLYFPKSLPRLLHLYPCLPHAW